jgi:acyl-CoA synthetase (AMP-forming)/AMP-acid ligase II
MNVSMLLDIAASAFGDRVVMGSGSEALTPERLCRLSGLGAAQIVNGGYDSVVYVSTYGPAFAVAMFSCARAGVPLVPLNYRMGSDQLGQLRANHRGALVLSDDTAKAGAIAPDQAAQGAGAWWRGLEADGPSSEDWPEAPSDPELPAVLLYTSGTTSTPKAVILRHRHLTSYVLGTVELGGADESDASLVSVPPYHIAGLANLLTNLYSGRRCVVLDAFDPAGWLDVARRENVTNALVVPTMLARLVEHLGEQPAQLPSLRSLAYGGARTPAPVLERALRLFPDAAFVHAYGLTETSSTIAVLGPGDHRAALSSEDPGVRARLGSVGQLIDGVEIEIRGVDASVLGPSQVGRIWLRGEQISGEYVGSAAALDEAGWFDTRDRGHVDADGYLFIEGRDDDTIIRGAENIAPAEIEDVLLRHPLVEDAVVVGIPDEEWGQRLAAAVVARDGSKPDPSELREWVRSHLRSSKTPDTVELWDDLPRTDNGKVIRRAVIERIEEIRGLEKIQIQILEGLA